MSTSTICDCGHRLEDHAAGPDADTTECMAGECDCPSFEVGDEREEAGQPDPWWEDVWQ